MNKKIQNAIKVVSDYLVRFYHEEPNDVRASSKAIKSLGGMFNSEWAVSDSFSVVLNSELPPNLLRDIVRDKANRYARDDSEAKSFLKTIYFENSLDCAIEVEEDD